MTLLRPVNLERRASPLSDFIHHCSFFNLFLRVKFSPDKFIDKRVGIGVMTCPFTVIEYVSRDFGVSEV